MPRLGGHHIALNILKLLEVMSGSGKAEVWVESGQLGEGTIQSVLSGKSYNKGMRAHKLT